MTSSISASLVHSAKSAGIVEVFPKESFAAREVAERICVHTGQKENLQNQLSRLKAQAQQELVNPDTINKFLESNLGILESADLEQCKKLCKQYTEKNNS